MRVSKLSPLGIIAGSGNLPREIIQSCQKQGRSFIILVYEGQTDLVTYQNFPHFKAHLGKVSETIGILRQKNIKDLVLAGRFRRPSWAEIKPDLMAAKWLAQAAKNIFGDDSLLKIIIQNLEQEGFIIHSSEDIVGPQLLAPVGAWGHILPSSEAQNDIQYGLKIARVLGQCDIGQAVIVQQGLIIGVEAIEGTDQLIARYKSFKREGPGGILVKIVKPLQETRVDRPTIGLQTVINAIEVGMSGIAVQADGVIVHDLSEMISLANDHQFFLIGVATHVLDIKS